MTTLVLPDTAIITLLFLHFAGLQVSDCRPVTPMGVTKWEMTLHTSVVAVDRVSSLVTGGEATGDDWAQFLLCVVRLYLLGVGRYPGSCLLILCHWQEKHSAGADKLVCWFSYFVGADLHVCRHCLGLCQSLVVVINLKPNTGFCAIVLHFALVRFSYVQLSGLNIETYDCM